MWTKTEYSWAAEATLSVSIPQEHLERQKPRQTWHVLWTGGKNKQVCLWRLILAQGPIKMLQTHQWNLGVAFWCLSSWWDLTENLQLKAKLMITLNRMWQMTLVLRRQDSNCWREVIAKAVIGFLSSHNLYLSITNNWLYVFLLFCLRQKSSCPKLVQHLEIDSSLWMSGRPRMQVKEATEGERFFFFFKSPQKKQWSHRKDRKSCKGVGWGQLVWKTASGRQRHCGVERERGWICNGKGCASFSWATCPPTLILMLWVNDEIWWTLF